MENTESKVGADKINTLEQDATNKTELILNSEKKGLAAISEVERRMNLDEAIEENLSSGLEKNNTFVKKYKIIGNKKVLVIELIKNKIKDTIKESPEPFVFDEKMAQAMKELEEELNDPFTRHTYNLLSETNKRILLDHLVDHPISYDETKIINNANNNDVINIISEANDNTISYSDNGYLVQLANKRDLKPDTKVDDKACLYNLISPDGKTLLQKLDYTSAMMLLGEQSENYQNKLKEDFSVIKEEEKNNSPESISTEPEKTVESALTNQEFESSTLFDKYLFNKLGEVNKEALGNNLTTPINRSKVSCWDFKYIEGLNIVSFSSVGYMAQLANIDNVRHENGIDAKSDQARYNLISPDGTLIYKDLSYEESQGHLWSDSEEYLNRLNQEFEANKIEIEKELSELEKDDEPRVVVIDEGANLESESTPTNYFNEKVSKYAESIGIKTEELASNKEFLNLSPEQQQFALETLRRTSLAKARVEAHQTFAEEKAGKKWWQVGFAMNQNFHKERHKVEAIKNIENRGLEGYGETELAWLTEVIKNGPEVKVNEVGEVIVNCLSDSGFSDEQKELIAKYNEEARNYIENNDKENQNYHNIKNELLSSCTDEEREQLFYRLNESEKNIQLLKFLSANKETEAMIQKMASRSLTGFDKVRAMAGAQKDKAGYSALGFVLRTGSKFALANSAYVASALTYSTAPLVAAMVGGLRGYNQGKKSLIENEELAQLGVTDKSATAKALNLAVGENSLKDKLDNLVDKLDKLRNEYASEEEVAKVEESLRARIYYTQIKMNEDSVSYGTTEERGANYLELTNSLVKANSIFWYHSNLISNSGAPYVDDDTKSLTRQTNLYKGIDLFNRIPDVSDPKYREWAQDKERFEELQKLSTEDRLASFLNYKEDAQSRKELKFLIKKTATGAVMGASFAAVGSFVAEHLGLSHWLSNKFNSSKNVAEAGVATKVLTHNNLKTNLSVATNETGNTNTNVIETTPKTVTSIPVKNVVESHEAIVNQIENKPIEAIKVPVSEIKITQPVNISPTETTVSGPEVTPVQPPTAPEITPSTTVTESVSQEVVDVKRVTVDVKELINAGNNAAKIADGVYSNNVNFRTEESFLKQISEINGGTKLSADEQLEAKNIFDSFKSNNDYNILRSRLISFENRISVANATETIEAPTVKVETPTSIETVPEVKPIVNNEMVSSVPVTEQVVPEVEVVDAQKAAATVNNLINIDNKAAKLVDGVYSNNPELRTEEAFIKQLSTDNSGAKLAPNEEAYARSAWKSFQENKDYNGFKRRVISLEEGISKRVSLNTETTVETLTVEKPYIADKISIAAELHTKPEALEQVGSNLVYKGIGKSNIVFDLKVGGIKEAVDASGKKIPNEFIKELINGSKISKFTRGGGLEKIFTSWNKLGSNDKLVYDSLSWFNKKTLSPEDLLGQIKGIYRVKTENTFIDTDNNHFITSDGKSFDMNLKGVNKLVAFLSKK
jgi:hypothetical protein